MKYLLDTHTAIWYFNGIPKLTQKVMEIIDDPENNIYISSISLWEIAIKINIGKLNLNITLDELFNSITEYDFDIIQIKNEYLIELSSLPLFHRDPFDRLLIATAKVERMAILTADENIYRYDVSWIW